MTQSEIKKFVAQQNALQKDIDKFSKQQKDYEREARNIAIGFGVDVVTTLFGGPILKGAFKGISLGDTLLELSKLPALANMPSREQALSQLAGLLNAPMNQFVSVLNQVPSALVRTLQAVREQKEQAES